MIEMNMKRKVRNGGLCKDGADNVAGGSGGKQIFALTGLACGVNFAPQ